MGINETGKIDFAKYVNNDNFKKAKTTKESKFVANVFDEAIKPRAIASKEIAMDGKLSVAEKNVLKNAIRNGVIQGLSAKELTDLQDNELEQFAQYVDDLSNNKVPAQTKQDMSALEEANKSLNAKLQKLQASMDSTTNVKNQEIKVLNEKYTAQQTELNNLKATEQKKAEAEKKQQEANNALLNRSAGSYTNRTWTKNDDQKCQKIKERFSRENIHIDTDNYFSDTRANDKPDLKMDLLDAISKDPAVMRRLSKGGNHNEISFQGSEYIYMHIDGKNLAGCELKPNTKIKDVVAFFGTVEL